MSVDVVLRLEPRDDEVVAAGRQTQLGELVAAQGRRAAARRRRSARWARRTRPCSSRRCPRRRRSGRPTSAPPATRRCGSTADRRRPTSRASTRGRRRGSRPGSGARAARAAGRVRGVEHDRGVGRGARPGGRRTAPCGSGSRASACGARAGARARMPRYVGARRGSSVRPAVDDAPSCPRVDEPAPDLLDAVSNPPYRPGRRASRPARCATPGRLVATIDRFLPLLIMSLDVYPVGLRGGTAVRGRPAEPAPCAAGQYAPAPETTARRGLPQDHQVHRDGPVVDVPQVEPDRLLPAQVRPAATPATGR